MTTNNQKKEILDLASNFEAFTKRHGWIANYDPESDELSIATPHLSQNARIRYADEELAFYITPNNQIEGIFMEYFKSNFVRHHKNLKKITSKLISKQSSTLVRLGSDTMKTIAPDLEETLRIILAQRLDLNFPIPGR